VLPTCEVPKNTSVFLSFALLLKEEMRALCLPWAKREGIDDRENVGINRIALSVIAAQHAATRLENGGE
jgi:hypothetical protein